MTDSTSRPGDRVVRWLLPLALLGACTRSGLGDGDVNDAIYAPFSLDGARTFLWTQSEPAVQGWDEAILLVSTSEQSCAEVVEAARAWDLLSLTLEGSGLMMLASVPAGGAWEGTFLGGSSYDVEGGDERYLVTVAFDAAVTYLLSGYYGGAGSWLRVDEAGAGGVRGEFAATYWWGDFEAEWCGEYVDTGDVEDTDDTDDTDDTGQVGGLQLASGGGDCDGSGWWYEARTDGLTRTATVDIHETGVDPKLAWSEQHELESIDHDPGGAWDELYLALDFAATTDDQVPGQSTLYPCTSAQKDVMTWMIRVWDTSGALADCAVWGHDPAYYASFDCEVWTR